MSWDGDELAHLRLTLAAENCCSWVRWAKMLRSLRRNLARRFWNQTCITSNNNERETVFVFVITLSSSVACQWPATLMTWLWLIGIAVATMTLSVRAGSPYGVQCFSTLSCRWQVVKPHRLKRPSPCSRHGCCPTTSSSVFLLDDDRVCIHAEADVATHTLQTSLPGCKQRDGTATETCLLACDHRHYWILRVDGQSGRRNSSLFNFCPPLSEYILQLMFNNPVHSLTFQYPASSRSSFASGGGSHLTMHRTIGLTD